MPGLSVCAGYARISWRTWPHKAWRASLSLSRRIRDVFKRIRAPPFALFQPLGLVELATINSILVHVCVWWTLCRNSLADDMMGTDGSTLGPLAAMFRGARTRKQLVAECRGACGRRDRKSPFPSQLAHSE